MRCNLLLRTCSLLVPALGLQACSEPEPPAPPPPAVEYQQVSLQPVAASYEFVARTRAKEDTEVRARITGNILERNFEEGQTVAAGTLLFRIDPRPYQAALKSAEAGLSQADASLVIAERNLARGQQLLPDGYISQAELDKLRSERDRAVGAREAAKAAIEKARLDLQFTDITAPFSGTVGRSQLSIGDLVGPNGGPLVTLVQRDPMLVDFDVDEQALANRVQDNQARAAQGLSPARLIPRLKLVTGDTYPHTGEINYADNRINPSTGTLTVTVSFPNPDGILLPGQFARITLQHSEPEMRLLIPQPSVLQDMQGHYVYTVSDENVVVRKNVTLGQREGVDWVVETGLAEGDRVIVNGIQKVRPKMPVKATPVTEAPFGKPAAGN